MTCAVNLDFFAAAGDQRELLQFLLSSTDARIFEHYSAFGSDLREFKSVAEVDAVFTLGRNLPGRGAQNVLQLWSPSVMSNLRIEVVNLDPKACDGHTFRYRIDGSGLMQLHLGIVTDNVVTMSHFGHQSRARAETRGAVEDVNWEALAKVSGKIQYQLRSKLAAGKVPGRPVLREALRLARSGYALKESHKSPTQYELLAQ